MSSPPPWADPRFLRFLAVGVLNTAFGYGLFLALVHLPIPLWLALLLSHTLGVLFNFKTTGGLVFANRDNRRLLHFGAVYGFLYVANLGALEALMALGLGVVPASALLILPMAALGFLLNRRFVFRPPADGGVA